MVSEVRLYLYLFNKENIWSNPQQFPASCIHSNNNSVDRIISKEEEREDIQGEILQSIFEYSGVSTNNTRITKIFEYSVFYSVSTRNPVILHTELILLQETLQLQGSSRVIPCRLHPATVPCVSKHSTRQNKAPTALQALHTQAGFQ